MWVFVVGILLFSFFLKTKTSSQASYPPGPRSLPIIGNILSVWSDLKKYKYHHRVWQSWFQVYGNILGLKFGLLKIVIVSGRELIKEVSTREVFDSRPDGFLYTMRSFGKKLGIVFSDGSTWFSTRRVLLKYLKHFGYGTRSMECLITEECRDLIKLRMSDAGTPVLVNQMFHVPITNILWRVVAGKRYSLNDERLIRLCELVTRLFRLSNMSGGVLTIMPFLRYVVPDLIGYNEMKSVHRKLHGFILETIKEHRDSIDINNPRDVIDAFLIEMMDNKTTAITEEELQIVCLDMLEAGMETVTNTAIFMLLHIVRNDEVQKLLQAEIDNVIGLSRSPSLDDRPNMVYTEAMLLETLRISSVASVGIPHMAREDALLGQYLIPKGTYVLLAIHDLHNSSDWEKPELFRPERFIRDGNLVQDERILAFGLGRRRCIGEGLAKSELFMFVTHLLQKFTLKIPQGDPMPSTEPIDGITLSARPFRLVFEPRFK
ncbi:farnesoate epoxidase-like [Achroia grisella]|uniref:farnesoate epoxidase-like n=1 Tax=Achroia grisella TaxID=688607 RepID=UPI0027D282C5|nr:farnesoate epoxidase-like [Achroia grisella]